MITPRLSPLKLTVPLLCAVFWGGPAFSQEERWFKVELLVFSQETPERLVQEQWAPFPELVYPEQARFLVDPARVEANLVEYGGVSEIDARGRQIITVEPPELVGEDIPYRDAVTDRDAAAKAVVDSQEVALEEAEDATAEDEPPEPFVLLPAAELEFAGKAAYMQRHGPYRVLFHQAWLQPLAEEADEPALILDRSGDTEEWPRLQGSIRLSLSRFLHLEASIWLNTEGSYLPGQWRMPPPPLAPPSLIIEGLPEPEPEPVSGPEDEPYFLTPEDGPAAAEIAGEDLQEPEDAYHFRHAVLLKQRRRMRSEEVHYLDHPLLGLVIKLTPYEWEAGDEGNLPASDQAE